MRDNRGQFIPDPEKPVLDDSPIIESAKQIPATYDRIAKLMGLDRKAPREKDESQEYNAMISWAEGLSETNRAQRAQIDELTSRLAQAEPEYVDAEVIYPPEIETPPDGE